MTSSVDVHGVIRRLKRATHTKSDIALSVALAVSRQRVTQIKGRGTVPYLAVIGYCARQGLLLDTIFFDATMRQQPRLSTEEVLMTIQNIYPILARLKRATGAKTDAALCEALNISTSGFSDMKCRGRLPWRAIVDYCFLNRKSLDDIVFGPCAFGRVAGRKNAEEGRACPPSW